MRGVTGAALPTTVAEVENASRLDGKLRIAREDPAASAPRTQRILVQPAPDCHTADLGHDAGGQHMAPQLGADEARQRQTKLGGQFTRQHFHIGDHARGKKQRVDLGGNDPRAHEAAYKRLRWIEFVEELPKTATGKIQRYRLP